MVQKYQNEIPPIFYYGISTKTSEKDLKIPNLQALTLGRIIKITLYKQNFIYSQSTINAIYMLDKIDYPLCFVIAHISAIHIILTPRSHPMSSFNF